MGNSYDDINFAYDIFGESLYLNKTLTINNIKIPNFYLNQQNTIFKKDMIIFELNHLIDKIFFANDLTFYENGTIQILPNDIVFDCGANMGLFSAAIAQKCKHVYSFEPMSLIRKNLKLTQQLYNNITVIPKGFWSNNVILPIELKDNPGASGLSQHDINHDNKIIYRELCSLITLDSFVQTTGIVPNFIKVDIEGSEIEFIKGAINTLTKYGPKLSLVSHYHKDNQNQELINLLIKCNYNCKVIFKKNDLLILGESNNVNHSTK